MKESDDGAPPQTPPMSQQNRPIMKRMRSMERAARKQAAAKTIPFAGVRTTRKIAKAHAYLKRHGLPHSEVVAALHRPRWRIYDETARYPDGAGRTLVGRIRRTARR